MFVLYLRGYIIIIFTISSSSSSFSIYYKLYRIHRESLSSTRYYIYIQIIILFRVREWGRRLTYRTMVTGKQQYWSLIYIYFYYICMSFMRVCSSSFRPHQNFENLSKNLGRTRANWFRIPPLSFSYPRGECASQRYIYVNLFLNKKAYVLHRGGGSGDVSYKSIILLSYV